MEWANLKAPSGLCIDYSGSQTRLNLKVLQDVQEILISRLLLFGVRSPGIGI
jgi:hypothetical protein